MPRSRRKQASPTDPVLFDLYAADPPPFELRWTGSGIELPELGLWLDATRKVNVCFVSHGHTDHSTRGHRRLICTPETAAVLAHRFGTDANLDVKRLDEPFRLGGATLMLIPAGHVLGSAQLVVERDGKRLVYTGDIKLGESLTCEPARLVPCDVLICECTFARPEFRFPPVAELRERIVAVAGREIDRGRTPVFLGYALGKGPEVAAILSAGGVKAMAHPAVYDMVRIYRRFGHALPDVTQYDTRRIAGRAVVAPPHVMRSAFGSSIANRYVVYVSGWAARSGAGFRLDADEAIPLSDHCDFEDTCRLIDTCDPHWVFVTHGFSKQLARHLIALGRQAIPMLT